MAYSAFSTEDQPESVDGGVVGVGVVAARVLAANRSQVRFIFLGWIFKFRGGRDSLIF